MDKLLRGLHTETFVLDLRQSLAEAPIIAGFKLVRVDDHTLEVEVSKEQSLNAVFTQFSALGIEVLSMRNKVNRLEEVFMRLVDNRSHT